MTTLAERLLAMSNQTGGLWNEQRALLREAAAALVSAETSPSETLKAFDQGFEAGRLAALSAAARAEGAPGVRRVACNCFRTRPPADWHHEAACPANGVDPRAVIYPDEVEARAEGASETELLDKIRALYKPLRDDQLYAAIERAWCAKANEEGFARLADKRFDEANQQLRVAEARAARYREALDKAHAIALKEAAEENDGDSFCLGWEQGAAEIAKRINALRADAALKEQP